MENRPDTFSVSHVIEHAELGAALSYALSHGYQDTSGVVHSLYRRQRVAASAANARDRARQLEGHRAAND